MIKPALKGCMTSANLSNIFFCSFIRMGISLDFEFLCSIYCGEKSRRFTPTATFAEVREDVVEKCVNIFRRISCGVILRYSYSG